MRRDVEARGAAGNHAKGADAAGIVLGNPGAVGVTSSSLVTMALKVSFGGQIKDVTEVLSKVPLTDVESIGSSGWVSQA